MTPPLTVESIVGLAQPSGQGAAAGTDYQFAQPALEALAANVVDALAADAGDAAAAALLEAAMFFDTRTASPVAAGQLLGMARNLCALLAERGALTADDLARRVEDHARQLRGGDPAVKVLDSGARPASTTAASPLARFLLQRDPANKPPAADDDE